MITIQLTDGNQNDDIHTPMFQLHLDLTWTAPELE